MHFLFGVLGKILHWGGMNFNADFSLHNDMPQYDVAMDAIYDECFGPGRFAKAAHLLRENNICVYEISRVLKYIPNGQIIGGCRMWPIKFQGGGIGLFLGPIAILPQYRKSGLGISLVQEVIKANEAKKDLPIFLVGDVGFFGRFGFKPIKEGQCHLPLPALAGRLLWQSQKLETLSSAFSGEICAP